MSTQYSQLKCHNRLKIVLTKNNKTFHSASPWRKTSYYEPFYCIIQIPFRQLEYKISHKFSGVILIGNHKEINLLSKWIDTNLVIWAICKIWTLSFKTSGGRTERRVLQWKSEKVICLFLPTENIYLNVELSVLLGKACTPSQGLVCCGIWDEHDSTMRYIFDLSWVVV